MSGKPSSASTKSVVLTGAAIGAGVTLATALLLRRLPYNKLAQRRRNRGLERALARACSESNGALQIGDNERFIIVSDLHRGVGDKADEFKFCERTYLAALEHYYALGFTLVLLGDVEELWEQRPQAVMRAYPKALALEQRFYQAGRYIRVVGNHDNAWNHPLLVQQYLEPLFPGLKPYQELLLKYRNGSGIEGEIFMVHGHQGTMYSDLLDFFPPYVLPFYRTFQNITNLGHNSPSRDAVLRSVQDNEMYRWSSGQGRLILIAGHTHRPVWSSLTQLDQLSMDLIHLLRLPPEQRPLDFIERVKNIQGLIAVQSAKYPPEDDIIKTRPCYFNTGCCVFKDGDISGIEIDRGVMSLVRWERQAKVDVDARNVLESMRLEELFALLEPPAGKPLAA